VCCVVLALASASASSSPLSAAVVDILLLGPGSSSDLSPLVSFLAPPASVPLGIFLRSWFLVGRLVAPRRCSSLGVYFSCCVLFRALDFPAQRNGLWKRSLSLSPSLSHRESLGSGQLFIRSLHSRCPSSDTDASIARPLSGLAHVGARPSFPVYARHHQQRRQRRKRRQRRLYKNEKPTTPPPAMWVPAESLSRTNENLVNEYFDEGEADCWVTCVSRCAFLVFEVCVFCVRVHPLTNEQTPVGAGTKPNAF